MLEIRLLGELAIAREGVPLALPKSRKTLALLAYLAATGRRHRRDRLCSLLWELPDDPRGALRWSLSKVRALVDEPERKRILADRESVALEADGAYIDVLAVREAHAKGLVDLPTPRLKALAEAWRGDFLEGLDLPDCRDFQAWCLAERDEARAAHAKVLRVLIDRLSIEPEAALPHARALAAIEPEGGDAHSVVETLRARSSDAGAPLPLPDRPSIAVLPFDNLSNDPDQAYFADGIADDIITELSRYRLLFVTARNSSFSYRGQAVDVKRVARNLGVQYIVEGSVRKAGNRIRLTVQLIDAATGNHVWAERYDRELDDVFAVQDEITENIVATIEPEFLAAEIRRARRKHETNLDAWDNTMRAFWHLARFTKEDNTEAQRLSHRATELDPKGARPYSLLAVAHVMDALYGWGECRDRSLHEAREAAEEAFALDDQDSLTTRVLGLVDLYSRRHDDAIRHFRRAIEICWTEAENHALLGNALCLSGDYDGGLIHVERALRLSPRDSFLPTWYNSLAMTATMTGRYEEGIEWAREAIQANPRLPGGYRSLVASLGHLGRADDACVALEKLLELLPKLTIAQARESLPIKHEVDLEHYLDGLRKAGLPA